MIKVGAATEVEMKEKKDRVDDAMHATRAAVEEGIVPGGGVALIRAEKAIDALKFDNADQKTGAAIIRRAIEEPLRQIVQNAGLEGSVVVNKVKEGKDAFGYNAKDRHLRRPHQGWRHRPGQGDPHGPQECLLHRLDDPHY